MNNRNIFTLGEMQNVTIEDDNTAWNKSISLEEKIKSKKISSNRKIVNSKLTKPKMKLSLNKKILIFVISLIIISAGIVIFKYLFYDRQNKSNYQFNINPTLNSTLNQTKKTGKFAIPEIKLNYSVDSSPAPKEHKIIDPVSDENSNFQRIYYFIDISQCPHQVDGKKIYASLKQLADSLKKASAMGITDIVFPQSSFDISEENTINQLIELVKEAGLNKIILNLFLDMQFSTPERVKHLLPEYFYVKTSSGNYSIYHGRYIHDQQNEMSERYISDYINNLTLIGINNFILGDLPSDIYEDYYGELHISLLINQFKLKERFNTIRNSALNINLLFSYSDKFEEDKIKSMDLDFSGAIFHLKNSDSELLKTEENFISQMFQEDEKKILMFDFKLVEIKEFSMRYLLGLYLFSPIPIILNIKDENYCPYTINILYEELLTSEEYELKEKFIEIVKVKRTDIYFDKKSVSIGRTFEREGVIFAKRGKDSNSMNDETLLYIYNDYFSEEFIPMDQIFGYKYPFKYQVIYDSKDLSNNGTILGGSSFTLNANQLLIVKIVK